MTMFIGQYQHNLDTKNRLIIPVKFREGLGDSFVVTKGLDGCLTIYTLSDWEKMLEKLSQIPATKKEARQYLRTLTSNAIECTLDNQGRIQLSQTLIAEANMKKSCIVIGVASHVEIWPEEHWNEYEDEAAQSFEDIAEELTEYL